MNFFKTCTFYKEHVTGILKIYPYIFCINPISQFVGLGFKKKIKEGDIELYRREGRKSNLVKGGYIFMEGGV